MTDIVRVALYTHGFAPQVGGVETYMGHLAEGLARGLGGTPEAPAPVTVITQTPAPPSADTGYPFRILRRPGARRLWRVLRDADVVHLAGPALLPLSLGLLGRKPVVVEHHGYQAVCPNGLLLQHPEKVACPGHFQARAYGACLRCNADQEGWRRSLTQLALTFPRRWLCTRATANVGVSEHTGRRNELPRMRTIHHGIPDPLGAPSRTAATGPHFAFVGRLVTEKGLPLLLHAAGRLGAEGHPVRLTVVGDGPERPALEELARELRIDHRVRFVGMLEPAEVEAALESVLAVVMPSVMEETAGLAAIEQMMRGRVVVAARIGGLAEIVGDAGLGFPPGDVAALTGCLRRLLEEPELAPRLGAAARERALREFGRERMVAEHWSLYAELSAPANAR